VAGRGRQWIQPRPRVIVDPLLGTSLVVGLPTAIAPAPRVGFKEGRYNAPSGSRRVPGEDVMLVPGSGPAGDRRRYGRVVTK